jgi:hypothetical protein
MQHNSCDAIRESASVMNKKIVISAVTAGKYTCTKFRISKNQKTTAPEEIAAICMLIILISGVKLRK